MSPDSTVTYVSGPYPADRLRGPLNANVYGANDLPVASSLITTDGNGSTITEGSGALALRILAVTSGRLERQTGAPRAVRVLAIIGAQIG